MASSDDRRGRASDRSLLHQGDSSSFLQEGSTSTSRFLPAERPSGMMRTDEESSSSSSSSPPGLLWGVRTPGAMTPAILSAAEGGEGAGDHPETAVVAFPKTVRRREEGEGPEAGSGQQHRPSFLNTKNSNNEIQAAVATSSSASLPLSSSFYPPYMALQQQQQGGGGGERRSSFRLNLSEGRQGEKHPHHHLPHSARKDVEVEGAHGVSQRKSEERESFFKHHHSSSQRWGMEDLFEEPEHHPPGRGRSAIHLSLFLSPSLLSLLLFSFGKSPDRLKSD